MIKIVKMKINLKTTIMNLKNNNSLKVNCNLLINYGILNRKIDNIQFDFL